MPLSSSKTLFHLIFHKLIRALCQRPKRTWLKNDLGREQSILTVLREPVCGCSLQIPRFVERADFGIVYDVFSKTCFASRSSSWALYHALAARVQCASGENPADPGEDKSRREAVVGKRGKACSEAADSLLALPIKSTTSTFLCSPFHNLLSLKGQ